LAGLILGLYIKIRKFDFLPKKSSDIKLILLGGILMGVHWVSYFYALSLSNIAIAMLTLHAFPAMTSILEPLILKTKFQNYHFILASLVIAGVWIILPSFNIENKTVIAVGLGLVSALSYALRNIWTRKIMIHYNGSVIMFYQLFVMTVLLFPFLFIFSSSYVMTDWPYLVALALFTTVMGHTLLVMSLKHFSAISVSLISSIIPVYGILWGVFFLQEIPNTKTLLGGSLIMASFLIETYYSQKKKPNA
jgi:drug/metabolite transporter (DMT)-like permease